MMYMKVLLFHSRPSHVLHQLVATTVRALTISHWRLSADRSWKRPVNGTETGIVMYDRRSKSKVPLILETEGNLKWYSCGPTVYDDAHIGHACSFVRFDIIRRILSKVFNINVVYAMNITDIDEKLILKSQQVGQTTEQLANHYTCSFLENMKRLNNLPTMTLRVTDYIPIIIQYIQRLVDTGHAYVTDQGNVYFRCSSYPEYNKLHIDEPTNTSLGDKESKEDFALWKVSRREEPVWDSPWSQGRPGWHIECTALASEVFGSSIDIHSGGFDLIFPHHENESAQSCCYHGTDRWVNYWIHSGLLRMSSDVSKMSKSLGNVISIDELLQRYTADHFRIFCLLSKYYTDIEFSDESMTKATKLHNKLTSLVMSAEMYINNPNRSDPVDARLLQKSLTLTQRTVRDALADNFDTPKAMSAIMNLVYACNIELNRTSANLYSQGGDRGSGVNAVAACISYISTIMEHLGVIVSPQKVHRRSSDNPEQLTNVLNSVVSFREKVRNVSLGGSVKGASSEEKARIKSHRKSHSALLDSCDQLRHELSTLADIDIQDTKDGRSYWTVGEKGKDNESAS